MYEPKPIDTGSVVLPPGMGGLIEALAESNHDNWALQRLEQGWQHGLSRNDTLKTHPGLVPYGELSEEEKGYDRTSSIETLKAIRVLGYCLINEANANRRSPDIAKGDPTT